MATLEEIYRNVLADEGERLALAQAACDDRQLAEFLAQHGCDATPEEARAFADRELAKTGELSGEELVAVSAGSGCGGGDGSNGMLRKRMDPESGSLYYGS